MRNVNCLAESAIILLINCSRPLQRKRRERAHKTHCIGENVEIKTILASSFPSGHSNIIIHACTKNVSSLTIFITN